jgi:hypothetical protein
MANAEFEYDVAVSFAGENRPKAEQFAGLLKAQGLNVFYDEWEQANLWGRDLYEHLDEVYRKKARYCVMFLSEAYARKAWTNHEEVRAGQGVPGEQRLHPAAADRRHRNPRHQADGGLP